MSLRTASHCPPGVETLRGRFGVWGVRGNRIICARWSLTCRSAANSAKLRASKHDGTIFRFPANLSYGRRHVGSYLARACADRHATRNGARRAVPLHRLQKRSRTRPGRGDRRAVRADFDGQTAALYLAGKLARSVPHSGRLGAIALSNQNVETRRGSGDRRLRHGAAGGGGGAE